jgi:hypothetical protein
MKLMVERIGPLVPAVATVGASVCATSLLLATGPQAVESPPVVPPLTREVGRVVASLSPPAQLLSRGRGPTARRVERRSLSAPPHGLASSPPTSYRSSGQASRPVRASSPPAPSPPSPLPAPPVTPAPAPVTVVQGTTYKQKRPKDASKPGWGHGDPNHDHTGPPGKGSKGQQNQPTSPGAGPPGQESKGQQNQPTSPGAGPPATPGGQHGSPQNGDKKSAGR